MAPSTGKQAELVCVTGASGHLGSWLVMRLLERGYRVRATVRDPNDPKKTSFLKALPGAAERLQIMRGQLLEEGSFDEAVFGCDGVFHCASPTEANFTFEDPFGDCIEPAIQGTINIIKACAKTPTIKRIVYTSSAGAIRFTQLEDTPNQIYTEECWTNVELCLQHKPPGWPYFVSKALSEKKALELAKEYNLDLIITNPTVVNGPFLLDKIPVSVSDAISLVTGDKSHHHFIRFIAYVHIDDTIDAHIFLYETPSAEGRYIVSSHDASLFEICQLLKKIYPSLKLSNNFDYVGKIIPHYFDNSKLKKLGFEFKHGLEDMLTGAVECCVAKGLLKHPKE